MHLPVNPAVQRRGVVRIIDRKGHASSRVSIIGHRGEVVKFDVLAGLGVRHCENGARSQDQRSNREFHCGALGGFQ